MICSVTCRKMGSHQLQLEMDVAASALLIYWETITTAMTAAAFVCCTDNFNEAELYLRLPSVLWGITSWQRGVHGGGLALLLGLYWTFWPNRQT